MSNNKRKINVTPRAKADLEEIWNYSFDVWGEVQADKYTQALFSKLEHLAQQPFIGRNRHDIAQKYYSFPHNEHVIFYIFDEENLNIIGILHKRMDVLNYFNN